MKELLARITKLIDVKTIITIILVVSTIQLVDAGKLDAEIIKTLVLMAVSFYLGSKSKDITPNLK
jgi:hypothetical protein